MEQVEVAKHSFVPAVMVLLKGFPGVGEGVADQIGIFRALVERTGGRERSFAGEEQE